MTPPRLANDGKELASRPLAHLLPPPTCLPATTPLSKFAEVFDVDDRSLAFASVQDMVPRCSRSPLTRLPLSQRRFLLVLKI